jgi:hypothetical protein
MNPSPRPGLSSMYHGSQLNKPRHGPLLKTPLSWAATYAELSKQAQSLNTQNVPHTDDDKSQSLPTESGPGSHSNPKLGAGWTGGGGGGWRARAQGG